MTLLEHTTTDVDEAFQRAMHRTLTATEDYTRRIHWWIRLFGIVFIVVPFVAAVAGVVFAASVIAFNAGS